MACPADSPTPMMVVMVMMHEPCIRGKLRARVRSSGHSGRGGRGGHSEHSGHSGPSGAGTRIFSSSCSRHPSSSDPGVPLQPAATSGAGASHCSGCASPKERSCTQHRNDDTHTHTRRDATRIAPLDGNPHQSRSPAAIQLARMKTSFPDLGLQTASHVLAGGHASDICHQQQSTCQLQPGRLS